MPWFLAVAVAATGPALSAGEPAAVTGAVPTRPPDATEGPRPVVLDADFGGGTLTRQLAYHQDLFGTLGGFSLAAGAAVGGSLAFYPAALWTRSFLANLGLVGEAAHTVGLSSATAAGTAYASASDRWVAALRLRIPWRFIEGGLSFGYGHEEFLLGALPGGPPPAVPDYSYGFLDARADLRLTFGRFSVAAEGGYLPVLVDGVASSGYFPHASAGGVEAGLGFAVALFAEVELRLSADYERFFLAFNPGLEDAHIAGGAIDQYLFGTLSAAVRLR